jgi:transcriptional regulator with XRE-family HTH domain
MITRIREVRKARGMTLADVATACVPPTTAQTIGRLETGTRTVSVGWLNRIARALGTEAADLVQLPDTADLPVAAILGSHGPVAPRRAQVIVPPRPQAGAIALVVEASAGEYRAGDVVWLERLAPDAFAAARNRDVLVPLAAGRFVFGRLTGETADMLEIATPAGRSGGARAVPRPAWLGAATRLVRPLA